MVRSNSVIVNVSGSIETGRLSVFSKREDDNSNISGYFVEIHDSAGLLTTGFTPLSNFQIAAGTYYVRIHDYQDGSFSHWGDGDSAREGEASALKQVVVKAGQTATLIAFYSFTSVPAGEKGITVFTYYEFNGINNYPWNEIVAAKQAYPKVDIICVANPSNGTEYWKQWVRDMKAALSELGIKVIGYVATGDCCGASPRSLSAIINNIDQVHSAGLDGVFFDESASAQSNRLEIYRQSVEHSRSLGMNINISNPGSCPAGISSQESIFDIICTYESAGRPSMDTISNCPISVAKKSVIPHTVPDFFDENYLIEALSRCNYYYEIRFDAAWHRHESFPPWFRDIARVINSKIS